MSNKWKSGLLSSGVPLEHHVAQILVKSGAAVSQDFVYSRKDHGHEKDFSVDIHATRYFTRAHRIKGHLHYLIECKYRSDQKIMLFFPDANVGDFSPVTLGRTIASIDEFSLTRLGYEHSTKFDSDLPFATKGIEIDIETGKTTEGELRHGFEQIRYALPELYRAEIAFTVGSHIEDMYPFLVVPILVTNAPLYIAKDKASLSDFRSAKSILDIADEVPLLGLYTDYGPDFVAHCKSVFEEFGNSLDGHRIRSLTASHKKAQGFHDTASRLVADFEASNGFLLKSLFTQMLVCNLANFETLVETVREVGRKTITTGKKLKLVEVSED